jgi:hypothetical protein
MQILQADYCSCIICIHDIHVNQSKYLPLPMTARDGGNAKRLSGTIFAIHAGNVEDKQKSCAIRVGYLLRVTLNTAN